MARTFYPFPVPQLVESEYRPGPYDLEVETKVLLGYFLDTDADKAEPEFVLAAERHGKIDLEIKPKHIQR